MCKNKSLLTLRSPSTGISIERLQLQGKNNVNQGDCIAVKYLEVNNIHVVTVLS